MKETNDLREQLEMAYEPTPEAFHRRVQDTLGQMRRERLREERVMKKKIKWAVVAVAVLLLVSAAGVAANMDRILGYITNTSAKNWVLDEAGDMLHTDTYEVHINDCVVGIREWLCDGGRLYVCLSIVDPALKTEGHYIPEDEDDLGGLDHYGLRYGPQQIELSAGEIVGGMTWDFMWGDEENNEILYILEQRIANVPDAFSVSIPFTCSAGAGTLTFDVDRESFGRIRAFAPSEVLQTQEYTAQITALCATAMRTYANLSLTFAEDVEDERRNQIAYSYQCGLLVPEGELDIEAGSGEEIAYGTLCEWATDRSSCVITLEGNPREDYPETVMMCPRWGVEEVEWDGLCPLSTEGAIVMSLKEVE